MPNETTDGQPPEQTTTPETPAVEVEARNRKIALTGLQRLGYAIAETNPEPAATPATDAPAAAAATETPPQAGEQAPAETAPADAAPAATEGAAPELTKEGEPAAAAPAAPARRVKKVEPAKALSAEDIAAAIVKAQQANAAPAAPAATAPAAAPEPELQPADREEYELARYAEQAEPEKYRDFSKRIVDFVQKRDALVQRIVEEGMREDPNYRFDPEDERFKRFVEQSKPSFQRGDRRKLEVAKIQDEAVQKAKQEFAKEKQELTREIRKVTVLPQIEQETTRVIENVLSLDDPAVKEFKADPKKFIETVPMEAEIIDAEARTVSALTTEYLKIAKGVEDPNPSNHLHVSLDGFIAAQGRLLDAMPAEKRVRADGKLLVSREQYAALAAKKDPRLAQVATFTDEDVVAMIEENGRLRIKQRLTETRTKLERSGYVRKAAAPAAAPAATPPKPAGTPAAAPAAAPAPSATTTRQSAPPARATDGGRPAHMKALGFG